MRRCNQCWLKKPSAAFWSDKRKRYLQDCNVCRANRALRNTVKNHRTGLPQFSELRFTIIPSSKNRKLGPIPEVYVTASTCPPSCSMFNAGCYGESGLMRQHWRNVEDPRHSSSWDELLEFVKSLPDGQLWRYAVLGDLPGEGEEVDWKRFVQLRAASHGKRGFTFTHKYRGYSPGDSLVVNISANSLVHADMLASAYGGPMAVVIPIGSPRRLRTPLGRLVIQCPATYREDVTCSTCGLCAKTFREPIIGFPAHGLRKREVSERAQ